MNGTKKEDKDLSMPRVDVPFIHWLKRTSPQALADAARTRPGSLSERAEVRVGQLLCPRHVYSNSGPAQRAGSSWNALLTSDRSLFTEVSLATNRRTPRLREPIRRAASFGS